MKMIWFFATVGLALVLFFVMSATPATKFLKAAMSKRPLVFVFYPEGRVELHVLKKNEEYGSGIIVTLSNGQQLAFVREQDTIFLFDGKIRVYLVYVPFGVTAHPAWMKWKRTERRILRKAGVSSLQELFAELEKYEDPKQGKIIEIEEILSSETAKKIAEAVAKGEDPREVVDAAELSKYMQARKEYERYQRLAAARDQLQVLMETLRPQDLDPLAKEFDAAIMGQLMETAAAREREKWVRRLEKIKTAAPIVGIIMAGGIIMIILLALLQGGGGINLLHAAQSTTAAIAGGAKAAATTSGATAHTAATATGATAGHAGAAATEGNVILTG